MLSRPHFRYLYFSGDCRIAGQLEPFVQHSERDIDDYMQLSPNPGPICIDVYVCRVFDAAMILYALEHKFVEILRARSAGHLMYRQVLVRP